MLSTLLQLLELKHIHSSANKRILLFFIAKLNYNKGVSFNTKKILDINLDKKENVLKRRTHTSSFLGLYVMLH